MMWKVFHKLFGWDYVLVQVYKSACVIRRVHKAPNGTRYIKLYGIEPEGWREWKYLT